MLSLHGTWQSGGTARKVYGVVGIRVQCQQEEVGAQKYHGQSRWRIQEPDRSWEVPCLTLGTYPICTAAPQAEHVSAHFFPLSGYALLQSSTHSGVGQFCVTVARSEDRGGNVVLDRRGGKDSEDGFKKHRQLTTLTASIVPAGRRISTHEGVGTLTRCDGKHAEGDNKGDQLHDDGARGVINWVRGWKKDVEERSKARLEASADIGGEWCF